MAENYTVETDIIYEGNGAVKEFPITFSFSDENEVVVYLNGEVIRRGYSIDGDSVVFNVAPADGDEIALAKATVDAPEEEESSSGESSESGSDTVYDQASREHIKINPVPAKVKYSGNGEVTEFPTGFAFFENDNIIVYLNGAIINSGYSITGVGETEGGSVIFDEAPKEGDKIVILRQVAIERVTDFQEGGAFRAKNINDELDRQTAFCQQIQEQIDRCVKVEVTEDQTPEELLAEVYGKLDSATEVAKEAVDAANAATDAVASAEKTLAEVNTYVDESKTEINELITKTTTEIDQTIADATEEIKEVAVNAANEAVQETIGASVIEAATSAEHARIWAEGEQAEVKPLGGELSSMGAADLAYALANAPEDTPIDTANMFAMNIFKGEKGDKGDKGDKGTDGKDGADGKSVFDGYATNCITEIPQDIKLELNNGVLTLKAGSKVYVPDGKNTDGSLKFDEVVIDTNKTLTNSYGNTYTNIAIGVRGNGNLYGDVMSTRWCSGATDILSSLTGTHLWYDTTNNIVKVMQGTTQVDTISLPICLMTNKGGEGFKSIAQVFNGFSYIGSTVFALPGVKGLIPNGRNEDGSLKNIEWRNSEVVTKTTTWSGNDADIMMYSGYINIVSKDSVKYNPNENRNYNTSSGNNFPATFVGKTDVNDLKINLFKPKFSFRAVDQSDVVDGGKIATTCWVNGYIDSADFKSYVSKLGMPSGKYIDLTLGASGSNYTAPANGWFLFGKRSSGGSQYISISKFSQEFVISWAVGGNHNLFVYAPAFKGETVATSYTTGGATQVARFYYAQGEI